MDRLIAPNTVPFGSHDTAPSTGTPGMASDGNPALSIAPTIWPAYAWNMIGEEIRNAIIAGGGTPDGTNWAQLAAAIKNLSAGRFLGFKGFGAAGTYTYTPSPGVLSIVIKMVGGGGAGGGAPATGASQYACGGGGGSGAYLLKRIGSPGSAQVVVGAGGQYAVGAPGGNGGSSSFVGFYAAQGGFGGSSGGPSSGGFTVNPGGGGGKNGTGDIEAGGTPGVSGQQIGITVIGGNGGPSAMFSGPGFGSAGLAGGSAVGSGCGGGGGSIGPNNPAVIGGNGADGYVLIEEYG